MDTDALEVTLFCQKSESQYTEFRSNTPFYNHTFLLRWLSIKFLVYYCPHLSSPALALPHRA